MSTYCPASEVQDLLPPNSVGTDADQITTAQLATCVTAGSDHVNAQLAHLYWPFTDYAASPAATPPWIVRRSAAYFGASEALYLLRQVNDGLGASDAAQARAYALEMLKPFIEGVQQIGPETATDTIKNTSWGDGDPYSSDEAPLSIANGDYVPGSARFPAATDYVLGEDFFISYKAGRRAWVITRGDSTIGNDGTGDILTYEVTRLKKRETVTTGNRSCRLLRG
jgi:hypothetical protein